MGQEVGAEKAMRQKTRRLGERGEEEEKWPLAQFAVRTALA